MRFQTVFVSALGLTMLSLVGQPAEALKTATATVACPKAKLQAAIDRAAPGVPTRITVTGVCSELIEVPAGKTITLVGNGSSEIKPPSSATTSTLLVTRGTLTLEKMKVTNLASADSMVLALGNSSLYVYGSTLSGPSISRLFEVGETATAKIFNSVINGGTDEALAVSSQSTLEIFGRPSVLAHFDSSVGNQTIVTTTANWAGLQCAQGGNLVLRAEGSGKVTVTNSVGPAARFSQCGLTVRNAATSAPSITLTGNSGSVVSELSTMSINNIKLESQSGFCIELNQSNSLLDNTTFGSCGAGQKKITQSFVDGAFVASQ